MTWSVGFRAPGRQLLADAVWSRHLEQIPNEIWSDPWLKASSNTGELPKKLIEGLAKEVMACSPNKVAVARLIAQVLSEPPDLAVFDAPARPGQQTAFKTRCQRQGMRLHGFTRAFYDHDGVYINGEACPMGKPMSQEYLLKRLLDQRRLGPKEMAGLKVSTAGWALLFDWYAAGWLLIGSD